MSDVKPVECLTCGSVRVVRHCIDTSPTCDLVKCVECQSFGNTKRWWSPESRRSA